MDYDFSFSNEELEEATAFIYESFKQLDKLLPSRGIYKWASLKSKIKNKFYQFLPKTGVKFNLPLIKQATEMYCKEVLDLYQNNDEAWRFYKTASYFVWKKEDNGEISSPLAEYMGILED